MTEKKNTIAHILYSSILSGFIISWAMGASLMAQYFTDQFLIGALIRPVGIVLIGLGGFKTYTSQLEKAATIGEEYLHGFANKIILILIGNIIGVMIGGAFALVYMPPGAIRIWRTWAIDISRMHPDRAFAYAIVTGMLIALAFNVSARHQHAIDKAICIYIPVAIIEMCGFFHCITILFFMLPVMFTSISPWAIAFIVLLGNTAGGLVGSDLVNRAFKAK